MQEKWQPMQYSHDTSNYWRKDLLPACSLFTRHLVVSQMQNVFYIVHDYELGPKPFSDRDDLNCVSYNKWKLTEYNDIILLFFFSIEWGIFPFRISYYTLNVPSFAPYVHTFACSEWECMRRLKEIFYVVLQLKCACALTPAQVKRFHYEWTNKSEKKGRINLASIFAMIRYHLVYLAKTIMYL